MIDSTSDYPSAGQYFQRFPHCLSSLFLTSHLSSSHFVSIQSRLSLLISIQEVCVIFTITILLTSSSTAVFDGESSFACR